VHLEPDQSAATVGMLGTTHRGNNMVSIPSSTAKTSHAMPKRSTDQRTLKQQYWRERRTAGQPRTRGGDAYRNSRVFILIVSMLRSEIGASF